MRITENRNNGRGQSEPDQGNPETWVPLGWGAKRLGPEQRLDGCFRALGNRSGGYRWWVTLVSWADTGGAGAVTAHERPHFLRSFPRISFSG
jgi:hypothetical protein